MGDGLRLGRNDLLPTPLRDPAGCSLGIVHPAYDEYLADPFVFSHAGAFFAVGTSPEGGDPSRTFPMLRSEDLRRWEPLGNGLVKPKPSPGTDYWAPEVASTPEGFYMYYSVGVGDRAHRLRVAFCERPEGPYQDLRQLKNCEKVPFAIDASPFLD